MHFKKLNVQVCTETKGIVVLSDIFILNMKSYSSLLAPVYIFVLFNKLQRYNFYVLSGGEDIFGFSSDGVTTGFWQGLTVVGGGITGI